MFSGVIRAIRGQNRQTPRRHTGAATCKNEFKFSLNRVDKIINTVDLKGYRFRQRPTLNLNPWLRHFNHALGILTSAFSVFRYDHHFRK